MSSQPFLILSVQAKKDVLAVRQKARLVAQLLRFEPHDEACLAAGAFAVGLQAMSQAGPSRICFLIERGQLHIFAHPVAAEAGPQLLRLAKCLPAASELDETDIAWLVTALNASVRRNLFDEVAKQNEEMLRLLHQLQRREEKPADSSAA